jgi:hypothetical protein
MLMQSVFGSNCRFEQVCSPMRSVKSSTGTRPTDEHSDGCLRIAATEIKTDTERLLKQKQCQSDISLMTDFVEGNCWVICEPVCNSGPNSVAFLKNCRGVSIHCRHLYTCVPPVHKKEWMWLQVWKRLRTPSLILNFFYYFSWFHFVETEKTFKALSFPSETLECWCKSDILRRTVISCCRLPLQ